MTGTISYRDHCVISAHKLKKKVRWKKFENIPIVVTHAISIYHIMCINVIQLLTEQIIFTNLYPSCKNTLPAPGIIFK